MLNNIMFSVTYSVNYNRLEYSTNRKMLTILQYEQIKLIIRRINFMIKICNNYA